MAEIRLPRLEQGQTKIKNVPVAVTPEGFWCCRSPPVIQKPVKLQNSKSSSLPTRNNSVKKNNEKRPSITDDGCDSLVLNAPLLNKKTLQNVPPKKMTIEFGEPGTSDVKVILLGMHGVVVKLCVHRSVLMENSTFFAAKISGEQLAFSCLEIDSCDDVEMYAETIDLMYSNDMKQRLIKQTVPCVLRILKVGERLGFMKCVRSCLEYLEAVPWAGEEEEEKVVSSVLRLQNEGIGVQPVLKRVSYNRAKPPEDIIRHVLELVLNSKEEKARREMKSIMMKLIKENNRLPSSSASSDLCNETIYASCRRSLDSLLSLYREVGKPGYVDKPINMKEPVVKLISFEADNLLWMVDILAESHAADEFAVSWANQQELASLHAELPVIARHHVSMITARILVLIGRGQVLPTKNVRHSLLKTWLQLLIDDYHWLQHGCRSFDQSVVEEGIGRTILTLPLEDQQSILLSWLGSFLKTSDGCPNLQRAFEVWWRRSFIRPRSSNSGILLQTGGASTQEADQE